MDPTRILLIEDSTSDALLLESSLAGEQGFPYELVRAGRLAEALALITGRTFDVALSDLGLPDSQGLATFTELHKNAPQVPIIVLTRNDDMETALSALKLGAQDYLPKGELGGVLLSKTIRYAMERNRLVRQLEEALAQVKTLSGLLPICGSCKKVRDDSGYWNQIETYVARHTDASFSHGICPECAVKQLEKSGIPVSESLRMAAAAGRKRKEQLP
jgi:DNA-binding NtrC family response regulator